ncbi:hypothetical protein MJ560_25455 [Klebsiella pneumoniae]|nr:hypothetical protein MJ560_25455 [Klebsiella pneumoniae]
MTPTGQSIRSNLQEARWLIKSLESRNDTLLGVSRCIVEQQQAFFEQGEEYMKPMVLADTAQAVEMHESTISRVTTQKYSYSLRGIFELKYFFSSHVNTRRRRRSLVDGDSRAGEEAHRRGKPRRSR